MVWILGISIGAICLLMIILMLFVLPKFKVIQSLIDKLNLIVRETLNGLPVIRAFANEKKEIDILKEENPNNLSWKTKQLRFNDTPLEKVIRDLNEYYQVEIINKVDSPDSRLTATFNDLPLDEVLMVINQTLDIRLVPRKDK